MNILHVVPTYLPAWRYGGPIKSVHGLCRGLASRGHRVVVFTTNVDGPNDLDVPLGIAVPIDGVEVRYFPCGIGRRIYRSPAMGRALREHVRSFDVVHLHSVFLWPTLTGAREARRAGVPYVLAPRGMLVRDLIARKSRWVKTAWINAFERGNLAAASSVQFTSRLEADEAQRLGLRMRRTCVVPNALDDDEIRDAEGAAADDVLPGARGFLLFLGRIDWVKGLDRLVRSIALVPGARLVVAGEDDRGYRATVEALARELGVADRIVFVGPQYGAAKTSLLRRAAALVLTSYSESFGNVVLEAMARGCPVVVTPEVGAADTVRDTGAGYVVDGRPEVFAAALSGLLADSAALRAMGERGHNAITRQFTWRAVAERVEDEYRRIMPA